MNNNKILLVDDSLSMLSFLTKIFKSDYEVEYKTNAYSALSLLDGGTMPDLIITDINMPEINGVEFVKRLKSNLQYNEIPIIVLSGNSETSDKINMLKMGVYDYVVKPFNMEELAVRAQRVVARCKNRIKL